MLERKGNVRDNGIHIRVGDILYGIMKHRVLIMALTAAGLMIGMVLSGISYLRGEMSKEYLITSSFSVNTQTNSGLFTSGYDFPSYNDMNMARDMVHAVSYVLKSDKMLKEIIESLGLLGITTKDIEDNLSFAQYEETQIIEASLYWRNANEGILILSEINDKAPQMLMEVLRVGSVSVINDPSSKYLIGGNVNIVLWGYMAMLGLGLGLGITLLELLMRPTLLNVQDMESVFGLEILCEIADDKAFFSRRSLLVDAGLKSKVGESFASAAHIIHNRLRKKEGPHMIYITSSLRSEGKTSVLANLAIQLSDQEKKVLLIDLDIKNPVLGSLFLNKVDYEHSLNALYAGDITEKEAITTLTGYMDILPAVLESSSIPLDSNLFHVIRALAKGYDYVLMDTAPVGLTADPMSLNQIASEALFVARYDGASFQEIKDALERIEKSGIGILGCVINGVQVSDKGVNHPVKGLEEREPEEMEEVLQYKDGFMEDLAKEAWQAEEEEEVTTSDGFVKLLFQSQDNGPEETPSEDGGAALAEGEEGPLADRAMAGAKEEPSPGVGAELAIQVKDRIFGRAVSNVRVELYDGSDGLVGVWISGRDEKALEQLSRGSYYVILNRRKKKKHKVDFTQEEPRQVCIVRLWTLWNTVEAVLGCCLLAAVVGAAVMLFGR